MSTELSYRYDAQRPSSFGRATHRMMKRTPTASEAASAAAVEATAAAAEEVHHTKPRRTPGKRNNSICNSPSASDSVIKRPPAVLIIFTGRQKSNLYSACCAFWSALCIYDIKAAETKERERHTSLHNFYTFTTYIVNGSKPRRSFSLRLKACLLLLLLLLLLFATPTSLLFPLLTVLRLSPLFQTSNASTESPHQFRQLSHLLLVVVLFLHHP